MNSGTIMCGSLSSKTSSVRSRHCAESDKCSSETACSKWAPPGQEKDRNTGRDFLPTEVWGNFYTISEMNRHFVIPEFPLPRRRLSTSISHILALLLLVLNTGWASGQDADQADFASKARSVSRLASTCPRSGSAPILTRVTTAINSSTAWCGMRSESILPLACQTRL